MSSQDMHDPQQYYEDNMGNMSYAELNEESRRQMEDEVREQQNRQYEDQMNEQAQMQAAMTGGSVYGEEDGDRYHYVEYPQQMHGTIDNNFNRNNMGEEHQNNMASFNAENTGTDQQINDKTTLQNFPRQVMTALGPLPLPEEFKNNIPEKFVAKPIIEEREIYVSKKERKQREVEVPHVQYEHTFKNIKKKFRVSKLIPTVSEVIKEVPKEILKPVIEEKIIEVPQGVKYVEVPVEVPCLYPPKIVPRVVTQYVERIVETVKPIVQEKIIEVPQTVIKQVPKIKTVEVPYYVPRYVEKIVEVPFRPNGEMPQIGSHMPFSISKTLPPLKPTHLLKNPSYMNATGPEMQHQKTPGFNNYYDMNKFMQNNNLGNSSAFAHTNMSNIPFHNTAEEKGSAISGSNGMRSHVYKNSIDEMPNFNMTMPVNHNRNTNQNMLFGQGMMFNSNQVTGRENLISQVENLPQRYNLPDGIQWGYPDGINQPPLKNNQVPPLVVTCPPEIGKVTCSRKNIQPDILTKTGVYGFDGFKKQGTAQALFPPLAHHSRVPFLPPPAVPGTPNIRNIEQSN